jgi:hypothetical protein
VKYDTPPSDFSTFVVPGILPKVINNAIGNPRPAIRAKGGRKANLASLSSSLLKAARGILVTVLLILF